MGMNWEVWTRSKRR